MVLHRRSTATAPADGGGRRLRRPARRRRALTIIEVLIVLALILGIGALAMPAIQRTIEERSFDVTVDLVLDDLRLARGHAQVTGRTVVVTWRDEPSRLEVRELGAENEDPDDFALATEADLLADDEPGDAAGRLVRASYAVRPLPGEVRVSATRPAFLDPEAPPDFESALEAAEEEAARRFEPEPDARLAVFLPDGSALIAADVWIIGADRRAGSVTVDPFTGQVEFVRVEPDPDLLAEEAANEAQFEEAEEDAGVPAPDDEDTGPLGRRRARPADGGDRPERRS